MAIEIPLIQCPMKYYSEDREIKPHRVVSVVVDLLPEDLLIGGRLSVGLLHALEVVDFQLLGRHSVIGEVLGDARIAHPTTLNVPVHFVASKMNRPLREN